MLAPSRPRRTPGVRPALRRVGHGGQTLSGDHKVMRKPDVGAALASADWLVQRYLSDLASIRDIAGELGCSTYKVTQALIRHGIRRRPVGSPKGVPSRDADQQEAYTQLRDRDFLERCYVTERMTIQEIADLTGCGPATVSKALHNSRIPVRWVGRRDTAQVEADWLAQRYLSDLASIRDIAGELGCSMSCVLDMLNRYGIPCRPPGTPKGQRAREIQVTRLRQVSAGKLREILVQADADAEAATVLGVSRAVLMEAIADAGIDRETVTQERRIRKRIAAWPALLRDRDRLAEALDTSSVAAVARLAGCTRQLVQSAALYHEIRIKIRATTRPAPQWIGRPLVSPAPTATAAVPDPTIKRLNDANVARTRVAAARTVDAARDMLREGGCSVRDRAVLQARVDHPQASLAELGAAFGTTKDAYAAMLRRALTGRYPAVLSRRA